MIGLSKQSQTSKKGKLKVKIEKVSKNKPTELEQEYLNWLRTQDYKCFVCDSPWENYHHVKTHSSDDKVHSEVIPLCLEHHMGTKLSPHGASRKFRLTFTMKQQRYVANNMFKDFLRSR